MEQGNESLRSGVFLNPAILDVGYKPTLDQVKHRSEEISHFGLNFDKVLFGNVPDNMLVSGITGIGKTMVTKLLTERLFLDAQNAGVRVKVCYVNCETYRTDMLLIKEINSALKEEAGNINIRVAYSYGANFSVFCNIVDHFHGIILIILDEIDKLDNIDVINQFARIRENEYSHKNVCLIGITNKGSFVSRLDPRTKSVIGQQDIIFYPYNAEQIRDILSSRAQFAFKSGALEETVIPLCAAYAAKDSGDARKAIRLLRMSGELADFERAIVVTEEHVKKARVLGEDRTMDSIISQLPLQSKCVLMGCLYIVLFEPPNVKLETGVIYSRYQEIARLIGVETLTQRRVTDLISELDMVGVVACKIESKGRFGRTKSVTLNIDAKKTWSIVVQNEKCLENIQDVMVKRRLTFGNFG